MKTITFFSEKGGVGKSSFSIMYASWLYHIHGVKVGLADFNFRIQNYRKQEIYKREEFLKDHPDSGLKPYDPNESWPIVTLNLREIEELRSEGRAYPHAVWLREECTKGRLKDCDVVICDFPGSLSGQEFLDNMYLRQIDLVVVPTERDSMTTHSVLKHMPLMKKGVEQSCCFVNKANVTLRNFRNTYIRYATEMKSCGVPMLPDMISYSERMMTIDKVDIIRSTFGFPDFSRPEFGETSDLGINNLFIDVTRLLAKGSEKFSDGKTDLSFVDRLQKTDDGRQFKGSSFPEFEI